MIIKNDVIVKRINYNSIDIQHCYYNNELVFCKTPDDYLTKTLGFHAITSAASDGSRSPADKISNYVYVYNTSLIIGRKYAFLLGTSGSRYGYRTLWNGTVISSRCYNSGYTSHIDGLTFNHIKTGLANGYAVFSYQGTFTYNPTIIIAGNGSSAYGSLICRNTYGNSDPGKGGAIAYIYEYECLKSIYNFAGWNFNEN